MSVNRISADADEESGPRGHPPVSAIMYLPYLFIVRHYTLFHKSWTCHLFRLRVPLQTSSTLINHGLAIMTSWAKDMRFVSRGIDLD